MFPQHFPPNLKLARLGPLPYFSCKVSCTFYIFTHARTVPSLPQPPYQINIFWISCATQKGRVSLVFSWDDMFLFLYFPESGDSMCNCGSVYVQFPDCDTAYFSLMGKSLIQSKSLGYVELRNIFVLLSPGYFWTHRLATWTEFPWETIKSIIECGKRSYDARKCTK